MTHAKTQRLFTTLSKWDLDKDDEIGEFEDSESIL